MKGGEDKNKVKNKKVEIRKTKTCKIVSLPNATQNLIY